MGEDPHALRSLLRQGGARAVGGLDPVADAGFLALELRVGPLTLRALSFSSEPQGAPLMLGARDAHALERALLLRDRQILLVTREGAAP